jgi:hypothetical protein
MPHIRFADTFCSLRASAAGLRERESRFITSVPIIPCSICDIVLGDCVLSQAMLPLSGTSLIFSVVKAQSPRRRYYHRD